MVKRSLFLLSFLALSTSIFAQSIQQTARPTAFIQNEGQAQDKSLKFYSSDRSAIYLYDDRIQIADIDIRFTRHNQQVEITGNNPTQNTLNYFGKNKSISQIHHYKQVMYKDIWQGIDMAFTILETGRVEFQFNVSPGADPDDIQLTISGQELSLSNIENDLFISQDGKSLFGISELKAYQGIKEIKVSPQVETKGEAYTLGYAVEDYDPNFALVIDPYVLIMASSGTDHAYEVATAANGDVYVVGQTGSTSDFLTPDHTMGNSVGGSDAFVSRFDGSMNLLATTIIASSGSDEALGVTIDTSNGNVFVCGTSKNVADFSINTTVFGTPAVNERNGFVAKLSPALDTIYATAVICSNEKDEAHSVLVGYNSEVFITGQAGHRNSFVCSGCPEKITEGDSNGNVEAFITKMSNDLSTHIKTVMLTSDAEDESYVVKADHNNNIFIAGRTKNYGDFADSKEYYGGQPNLKFGYSAFVIKFNYNLSLQKTGILASEIVSDVIRAMVIDANGNVYVAGLTEDAGSFPKEPKYYYGSSTTPDAFVVRLNNSLANHGATAILCSSDKDKAYGLALDENQNIVVGGYSMNPTNFGENRVIDGHIGSEDGFVMKLSNTLSQHISTNIYSSDEIDIIYDIAYAADGGLILVGETDDTPNLTDNPNTVLGTSAGTDAFVIKIGGTVTSNETEEDIQPQAQIVNSPEGNILRLNLHEAAYIGYEIYSLDGKLIEMHSKGFSSKGQYSFTLPNQQANGVYLVKIRIGNEVMGLKYFK